MNKTPTDCPFCRVNGLLKGDVVAETKQAFLIEFNFGKGYYLIVPDAHAESLQDLPDNWWADFKQLLGKVPDLASEYNLSLNYGKNAGQTVKHLHFWIVPRSGGKPSSGKGLAGFIKESDG